MLFAQTSSPAGNSELYDLLVQMGKADDLPVEPAGDDQDD